jgi:ferredoxin
VGIMRPEPDVFEIVLVLPHEERSIRVCRDTHIWDAASAAGIVLPALCHQGYCLTCAARLEDRGKVDQSDSLEYLPEDRRAGFVLLCTAKPCSGLRIRTHQQNKMREFRKQNGLPAPYSWRQE